MGPLEVVFCEKIKYRKYVTARSPRRYCYFGYVPEHSCVALSVEILVLDCIWSNKRSFAILKKQIGTCLLNKSIRCTVLRQFQTL